MNLTTEVELAAVFNQIIATVVMPFSILTRYFS